jgi:hypothetical protein
MFNADKKLEYYEILNTIRMDYLKSKEPFDMNLNNVKLTYNDIQIKYLNNKNYFIAKPSFKDGKQYKKNSRGSTIYDKHTTGHKSIKDKSYKTPTFTPEETAAYLERKKRREQSPHRRGQSDIKKKGGSNMAKQIRIFC